MSGNRYHLIVVIGYVIFVMFLFVFSPYTLNYNPGVPTQATVICFVAAVFGTFGYVTWRNPARISLQPNLPFKKTIWIVIYSLLFAVPEEIIFRGIIQTEISAFIVSPLIIISSSAAIFALAHAFNGANGLYPTKWNWQLILLTFVAGVPLALLFNLTESLFWPTLLHFIYLVILQIFLPQKGLKNN